MRNNQIRSYLILTFVWSWVLWIPLTLPYFGLFEMNDAIEGLIMPAVMIGAFGPLFAAVTISYRKGKMPEVKRYFKKCFDFKVKPLYILVAIILGLGTTMIAHYITTLSGLSQLPTTFFPDDLGVPIFVVVILYTFLLLLLGGGQEEFGWRGFLQDLIQDKYGVILGSGIIGLFWAVWHLPLWFIEGEGHAYYSFFAFMLYTVSWSVTIGIIYNKCGKKMVIPWIMHTVGNLSVPLFPVLFMENVPQPGYWIWASVNVIVAISLSIWLVRPKIRTNVSYQ